MLNVFKNFLSGRRVLNILSYSVIKLKFSELLLKQTLKSIFIVHFRMKAKKYTKAVMQSFK